MLPAIATYVHVSVVHTALGSPCTYRKRVLYIAFTHVLPSVQFVARFVIHEFPESLRQKVYRLLRIRQRRCLSSLH